MLKRLALFAPQHWHTWLGLGLLRIVEPLPYGWRLAIGRAFGKLAYRLPLSYVRIARRNIDLCFPDLDAAEREKLLRLHFDDLGIGVFETAVTWWSSNERVRALATVEGLPHLHAALAKGRGVILVGGHFTTIEIATRILGTLMPASALYRAPKNKVLAHVCETNTARYAQRAIQHDDIRSLIRALKENGAVWYAPDQAYRKKGAAMVPFFGIPAATATATSRLAKMTGATVLTFFPERLPGNEGYRVTIGAPIEDFPGPCCIADAEHFGALLEAHIRKIPSQYFWVHRRFKGLSSDYPDYYGRDARAKTPLDEIPAPIPEVVS
jgi:KDO2-lipid IV(A) lauroyltransferase